MPSRSLITPSLLVWREVYSFCLLLCVGDDPRRACFNLFKGAGINVAAVSSEMELTDRSHSDNNRPLSGSLPFLLLHHIRFPHPFVDFNISFLYLLPTSSFLNLSICFYYSYHFFIQRLRRIVPKVYIFSLLPTTESKKVDKVFALF